MATVKFYAPGDLINPVPEIGDVTYADTRTLVIETADSETYYYGIFSYPNGVWSGTITDIFGFDLLGNALGYATGLSVDTVYATDGPAALNFNPVALRGPDTIDGSAFSDRLRGHAGNDLVYGRGGNDMLVGDVGDDRVFGGPGQDRLNGGTGGDWMDGGTGNDVYDLDNIGDRVIEAAGGGVDTVVSTRSYTLAANVENLTLAGIGAINGTGNGLANVLRGNVAGNSLNGGGRADQMIGGDGNDIYFLDNSGDVVVEAFGQGIDTVQSIVSHALAGSVENLTLTGAAAINGSGNAINNTLRGNATSNVLVGALGADVLLAGAGKDVLVGALGRDVSAGGVGADSFVFRSAAEAGIGTVHDVIQDFAAGIDKIVLAAIDANLLQGGNQAFVFVGANAFSGTAAELRFFGGVAAADLNGDGLADLEIAVQNVAQLAATDFVL